MTWKTKVAVSATGVAAVGVIVFWAWQAHTHDRRQVECWVEQIYLPHRNLAHQRHQHFSSYAEWSKAGKAIAGADMILVSKYRKSEDREEQGRLLYAMGAVPTPTTIAFLSNTLLSTRDSELREHVLTYGLLPNIAEPAVQEVLVSFVKNTQQSLADRCWVLAELLHAGSKEAIAYAKVQGQELLSKADASEVDSRCKTLLAEQMRKLTPASQPVPIDE